MSRYMDSLQSLRYPSNLQLPNPTTYYEKTSKLHSRYPRAIIGIAVVIFIFFWKDIIASSWSHISNTRTAGIAVVADGNPILNSTLGFQDIFLLSLPDRGDRRAPLLAGANATNLTITTLDAIRDKQIPPEDYPKWWATNGWVAKEGELGCLMSHLRTWKKIIHENITSALVMESDVDWDMRVKNTMLGVGRGTKAIADWPFDPEPSPEDQTSLSRHAKNFKMPDLSPYGDKWDIIWAGHCGSSGNGDGRIYAFPDEAAPDEDHKWSVGETPRADHRPLGTRIVYQADKSVCTTAYAISNQGARKFEERFREANGPIDLKMWSICADDPKVACIGVFPQVFSMAESRTNIKHTEGGLSFGHEITEEKIAAGKSIMVSARVNADMGLADKGPEGWKWEWKPGDKTEERLRQEEEERQWAEQQAQEQNKSNDESQAR